MTIITGGVIAGTAGVLNGSLKVTQTDSLGNETIQPVGAKDNNNSTVTPLAANGVFVGTSTNLEKFRSTIVTINCLQSSAVNGVELQGSFDGATWEVWRTFTFNASAFSQSFQFYVPFKFFRLRFINNTTLQSAFKLDVIHSLNSPLPSFSSGNTLKLEDLQQEYGTFRTITGLLSPTGAVTNRRGTIIAQNRPAVSTGLSAVAVIANPGALNRLYIHKITLTALVAATAVTAASVSCTLTGSGDLGTIISTLQCPTAAFTAVSKIIFESTEFPVALAANAALIVTLPAVTNLQYELEFQYHIGAV